MIDLNNAAKQARNNAIERQKNGARINADTYPMLKHCATEVVEAMNAYDFMKFNKNIRYTLKVDDETLQEDLEHFSSELADIVCCVLIIAASEKIDVEKAIENCLEKNRRRAEGTGDKK